MGDGLHMFGEAIGAPLSTVAVAVQCRGDVHLKHGGVLAESLLAGCLDRRMRLVSLLNQAAEQTGEFG